MNNIEVIGLNGIEVKMIVDSLSPDGVRLPTMQLKYHHYIHSEFMTHRVFSRNASSSRAIPTKTLLESVRNNPMMPIHWGSNKPGMQAGDELTGTNLDITKGAWLVAAEQSVSVVEKMQKYGLHKQVANRLLEPFLPITVVVTATEWENFFALRNHKDAQPEIQELAKCMKDCMNNSTPKSLKYKEWHLPYVRDREIKAWTLEFGLESAMSIAIRSSAARCARVSYLNHDKSGCTLDGDFKLFNMLAMRPYDDGKGHALSETDPVHLSPLEHQATPQQDMFLQGVTHQDRKLNKWSGNLRGWIQFRQLPFMSNSIQPAK